MPQVATTVEYSNKEITDLLVDGAKRAINGNTGSAKVSFVAGDGATVKDVRAVVSFEPIARMTREKGA